KRAAQSEPTDVIISEIGGTVGDIESLPFLEALRQFRREVGPENVIYIHVTLVPFIEAAGELKTKPTQHSVNELRRIGIHPDVIVCRSHEELSRDIRVEIALVGKYVKLQDAYLSVHEALKHAGLHNGCAVRVRWVDAENMSYEETAELLETVDGVLVPGGFGSRGWEGKILACRAAREG